MKLLIVIIVPVFIISCDHKQEKTDTINYTGFSEKKVHLSVLDTGYKQKDTIALIQFKIPNRLDTFYHWHQQSDCTSCGWLQYRFADKRYSQFAESGWFWTTVPDSVYQLSIKHKPLNEAPEGFDAPPLTEKDTTLGLHLAFTFSLNKRPSSLSLDFQHINNRPLILATFISPYGDLTHDTTLYVCGITNLKRNILYFIGECGAKDTTGFARDIYKTIQSVEIEER